MALSVKESTSKFRKCSARLFLLYLFPIFNFLLYSNLWGQIFHMTNLETLYEIQINSNYCGCSIQPIGPTGGYGHGISFGPDGNLYYLYGDVIRQADILTGNFTTIFTGPSYLPDMSGFISAGGGIFYSMSLYLTLTDTLYRWNINSGIVTALGSTGYRSFTEMTIAEGEIYYVTEDVLPFMYTIIRLDTLSPSNSEIVVSYPVNYWMVGLTAAPFCNTLLGTNANTNELAFISLIDGAITPICNLGPVPGHNISSPLEFASMLPCAASLDLDCNDSSGATDADYNSPDFDCLSDGVGIADDDIRLLYDAIITEMTIQVIGFMPDAPNEIVDISGSVPNINVMGAGTDMMTLTNAGGARSTDFKDALQLIVYNNTAIYPTAGLRTVEVQFTTESGMMSNIATAFIQVNELSLINVDLGPDQERCDGETATFDAGNSGASYQWSNGPTSQSITVGNSGQYIVTVSNGINCPNQDTVELNIIPVIHVSLTGDTEICDNEQANLTINTDTPFPLDVEITPDPGSPFTFTDVTGNLDFFDFPGFTTEYTITNVIPSQPACIEITDPTQVIYIYPTYVNNVDVSICDGDSIWLGYYWETEAGQYEILFYSADGCDSTVNFTINILPAVNILIQATTCDPAEVGIFITSIDNPTGCDTLVQTSVSLLPSDTTAISLTSCNSSNTGVFTQLLTNQAGCDSIVITTLTYAISHYNDVYMTSCDSADLGIFMDTLTANDGCDSLVTITITNAPADTSYLSSTSCDSAAIGVFQLHLSNQSGCDSLVITTVSAGIPDTTYLSATSCDSASLGVFEQHFSSQSGCDSTVITTIVYAINDFTYINTSSCDSNETGIFHDSLVNRFGCDSIVITIVAYAISHYTSIDAFSCDPADTGVIVQTFTNQYGCDSIVTTTIAYAISDYISLTSSSCDPADVGVFVESLSNQYGCDSIVTLTVSLVPADTTILSFNTCDPAQVGSIQNTFTNQDGCDSLVIEQTSLYPLPVLLVEVTSDFNGYDISCKGESDGRVTADVIGVQPLTYMWSTGSPDQSITGLSAGSYAVTVTDGNGCKTEGEVILLEPEPFAISFVISQPDCFDQNNGSITVEQTGGINPIRYSIDGVDYQPFKSFSDLSGGTYQITALDANDCEVKEIIWINVPISVEVNLGDDQIILLGDTAIIQAIVNVPFDSLASIVWSGLTNPNCLNCLTQPVAPIITTTYSVSVTNIDGCTDEDAMTLFLERNIDIYIPNIFSPNGDNINDRLLISAGPDVDEISSLIIYDRWGNMVFSADHFPANDPAYGWDGTLKGNHLNSAVFAYKLIGVFKDGRSEVRYGDVTLVK